MRSFFLTLSISLFITNACGQFIEPSNGLYPTNLIIFQDELKKGFTVEMWGVKSSIDQTTKKSGSTSWRWDVSGPSGMHVLWGGWTMDTTVFWVSEYSHLSFWAYPSSDKIRFAVQLGYMEGQHEIIAMRQVGPALEWKYYDVLVPSAATRKPLNDIKILVSVDDNASGTVFFDEMKISQVRLYAGKGTPESIKGVFADQIGYDTYGIKTFSAEKYKSYSIARASDGKVMYTGTDVRMISSRVIADYAAYVGDFSKFQTPGRYVIQLDNGRKSYPFNIGPSVYDSTLRAALRFFYYQRCNNAVTMPYAEGPWVHEKDEKELVLMPRSMGGTKYVRKGWHDAGDLSVYMPDNVYACFWLASAWDDYRFASDQLNIPESGNGVPDLLDELRWGLDWIIEMQDTTDGGFFHNMGVLKNSSYTYGRTTPLTITGFELTNKTTSATAAATAMLAYASTIFNDAKLDPSYAARMRNAALKGWDFLQSHPRQINITEGNDMYQDPDDIHARFFAACALFLATGEEKYDKYVMTNDPGIQWIPDYNNQTSLGYLLYLKSPKANATKQNELRSLLIERAKEANADRDKHPFGFVGHYYWGSLGTSFARSGTFCLYDWNTTRNQSSLFTALQQLHYTFGQNSLNFVYLSGFGSNGMKNGFHHWLKALNATPRDFSGLLAGGPNETPDANDRSYPNNLPYPTWGYWGDPVNPRSGSTPIDGRYTDNDSWSTNEVAVNQNAQLVYVLCAAYAYAHGKK